MCAKVVNVAPLCCCASKATMGRIMLRVLDGKLLITNETKSNCISLSESWEDAWIEAASR